MALASNPGNALVAGAAVSANLYLLSLEVEDEVVDPSDFVDSDLELSDLAPPVASAFASDEEPPVAPLPPPEAESDFPESLPLADFPCFA
jgi:hypothetical protein